MTTLLERAPTHHTKSSEGLDTIELHRHEMGEHFELTPLDQEFAFYMHRLGANGLYLADAAANHAGTFKWRGALNKMTELQKEGERAVIVPSAGNHLRGAVMSAKVLGMTIHGVVPTTAPAAKKEGARKLWGDTNMFQLHVQGDSFDDALRWALENDHLGALVHPFDDPDVAKGQGTIADDTLRAFEAMGVQLDHVVVPVGGGGLLTGVAERFSELDPRVMVHGVEASGSDSLSRSAAVGSVTSASRPNKRYGGSAVKRTGTRTLDMYGRLPNIQLWQASDAEVALLTEDYLDEITYRELGKRSDFTPFEPTTLVAIAGLRQIASHYPDQTIAVIGTGRNESPEAIWNQR